MDYSLGLNEFNNGFLDRNDQKMPKWLFSLVWYNEAQLS